MEKIINRLNQLIELGNQVLSSKSSSSADPNILVVGHDPLDDKLFYKWKIGSLSFLKTVFNESGVHFEEFQKSCKRNFYNDAIKGQSILEAAKEDIEGGHLKKIEELVAADIFVDFLEMAEYLLDQGFKDPAASLIGAVLEDGLRKISEKNNITVKGKENIKSLNDKLSDKIYNKLTQKRVYVWNDIRNKADHKNSLNITMKMLKRC